jgi:hypothetical protein
MTAALLSVATAVPKKVFAATLPQDVPYQTGTAVYHLQAAQRPVFGTIIARQGDVDTYVASSVFHAPPVQAAAPQSPVISSILGQGQEDQSQRAPSVYHVQGAQRPLFGTVLTSPQQSPEIAPSAVYTTTQNLQRPVWGSVLGRQHDQDTYVAAAVYSQLGKQRPLFGTVLTTPQENPSQYGSDVYRFPPPSVSANPVIRQVIATQAEWPQLAPSWSLVNTAVLPSFVAGTPPLTTWVQTTPQEQGLYEINYSFVATPTASLIPDTAPIAPVPGGSNAGGGGGWHQGENARFNLKGSPGFDFSPKKGKKLQKVRKPTVPEVSPELVSAQPQIAEVIRHIDDDELAIMLLLGARVDFPSQPGVDDDDEAITVLLT